MVEIKIDGKEQPVVDLKLRMLKDDFTPEEIQMFKEATYTTETVVLDQEYWGPQPDLLTVQFNLGLTKAVILHGELKKSNVEIDYDDFKSYQNLLNTSFPTKTVFIFDADLETMVREAYADDGNRE